MADQFGGRYGKLAKYVESCAALRDRVRLLLADFEEIDGGLDLHYIVDYSELRAFVLPDNSPPAFRLFHDDRDPDLRAWQDHALARIVFGLGERLTILPTQAIEMDELFEIEAMSALSGLMKHAAHALNELERLIKQPDVGKLLREAETMLDGGHGIPDTLAKNLGRFFSDASPHLVDIVRADPSAERYRLDQLLERLRDLPAYVEDVTYVDESVENRWLGALQRRRTVGRPNNFLDAKTMGIVAGLQNRYHSQGLRLRFITRSNIMHEIFREEYAEGLWESSHGYILVHPKAFSCLLLSDASDSSVSSETIRKSFQTLDTFINIASRMYMVSERRLGARAIGEERIVHQIERMKRAWHQSAALWTSARLLPRAKTMESRAELAIIVSLLRVVRDSADFAGIIRNRLRKLSTSLQWDHGLLGWYLETDDDEKQFRISNEIKVEHYSGKRVVKSKLATMPYTLQFHSSSFNELLQHIENLETIEYSEVCELLAQQVEYFDYEPLLFMAYLLAVVGTWDIAEQYCSIAIGTSDSDRSAELYECYFFRAVCRRKKRHSNRDEHLDSIEDIDRAMFLKSQRGLDLETADPRYCCEKAVLILSLNGLLESESPDLTGNLEVKYSDEVAVDLLYSAFGLVRDDKQLKVHILNNLCYHFLQGQQYELAGQLLDDLRDGLTVLWDRKKWPAAIVDTLLWGQFLIEGQAMPNDTLIQLERDLSRIVSERRDVSDGLTDVGEHIDAIRKEISRRGLPAPDR